MPRLAINTYIDIAFGLLVAVFLAWIFREGEKRIQAADEKAITAQVVHNAEVNQRAQSAIQAAEEHYRALYANPPIAPVHVSVCDAPGRRPLPSPSIAGGATGPTRPDGAANVPAQMGSARDIGPDTDHLFDQADAQIEALQAIVRAQQQQMESAHGK